MIEIVPRWSPEEVLGGDMLQQLRIIGARSKLNARIMAKVAANAAGIGGAAADGVWRTNSQGQQEMRISGVDELRRFLASQ